MHLADITPKAFACGFGACSKLLATDDGRVIVIGVAVPVSELGEHGKSIAENEQAVAISKEMLKGLIVISKEKLVAKLLKSASFFQREEVEKAIRKMQEYEGGFLTRSGWPKTSRAAIRAFKAGDYKDEKIAQCLSCDILGKLFGCEVVKMLLHPRHF
jgi:hypothetical protein